MALKKFIEYSNYIEIGDFLTTKNIKSENYGSYKVTKIATIDFIKACEDMKLSNIHDIYCKILKKFVTVRSVELDSKNFNGTNLQKFEIYVPISEDNIDWIGNKHYSVGELPIAFTKNYVSDFLKKLL